MANQTYKFSDLKQALKQGASAAVVNDIVAHLSSTDINKAVQTFSPGMEQTLVSDLTADNLQKVASSLDASTAAHLANLPPEFLAFAPATYNDTIALDHFADTVGTFHATDINQNTLTYGLAGSAGTSMTLDGISYDRAAVSDYGILLLSSASGAYHFMADDGAINALTTTATASFTITVSDGTNAPVSQAFNITLNGVNDAPVVSGTVTGQATEDGAVAALNALANATDVDAGQALSVVNVPGSLPAGVSYDAAMHTFSFDPGNSAYQHLAQGTQATVSVTYDVTDGAATTHDSASWTITGVNDAPVVGAALHGAVTASSGTSPSVFDGLANATDVDDNTTLSVVNVQNQLPAGVSYDAAHHTFSFEANDAAYAGLANGVTEDVTVHYGVSDGIAPPVDDSVTWTVTGTREAPVAADDALSSGPSGSGWVLNSDNGHYYKLVTVGSGMDWSSAEAAAHVDGAYLATITSAAEQQFAQNVVNGHGAWLGAYAPSTVSQLSSWHWMDGPEVGTKLTYMDWHVGEPNGFPGYTDAGLHMEADGGWNDVPGPWALTGYLEEWGGLPVNNSVVDIPVAKLLGNDGSIQPGALLSLASFDATSADGATISTLHYDPTTSSLLQQLGGSDVANDTFTYTVKDQYGLVSNSATVTIPVHGIPVASVPAANVVHTTDGGTFEATSAADYFVVDPNTYVSISGFDTANDKLVFEHTAPDSGYVWDYSDPGFETDYLQYGDNGGVQVQSITSPLWDGPKTSVYAWDSNSWTQADLVGVAPDPHTFYDHNVVVTPGAFLL